MNSQMRDIVRGFERSDVMFSEILMDEFEDDLQLADFEHKIAIRVHSKFRYRE